MITGTHRCNRLPGLRRWFVNRKLEKLKLDTDQRVMLDNAIDKALSTVATQRDAAHDLHQHMIGMVSRGELQRDTIADAIRTAAIQQAEQATATVDMFMDVYDKLETWQQAEVQRMLSRYRSRHVRCGH